MNALLVALEIASKVADTHAAIAEAKLYLAAERAALESLTSRMIADRLPQYVIAGSEEYVNRRSRIDDLEQTVATLVGMNDALHMAHEALRTWPVAELDEAASAEVSKLLSMSCEPAMAYLEDVEDLFAEVDHAEA